MILTDFALLASDTSRTKAYLQLMLKNDLRPAFCLVYTDDHSGMRNTAEAYKGSHDFGEYFNKDIPLLTIIEDYNLPYSVIEEKDINSDQLIRSISDLKQNYIIYSGYGGGILKPPLFQLGKKYIHVHAGKVPEYRGSTTAYYSIIDNRNIGVTAFFLDEGLDDGEIISQHEYELPKDNVDIDYIYEPYLRAVELVNSLISYTENDGFKTIPQADDRSETYFIIHPVLKHIAIKMVMKGLGK